MLDFMSGVHTDILYLHTLHSDRHAVGVCGWQQNESMLSYLPTARDFLMLLAHWSTR